MARSNGKATTKTRTPVRRGAVTGNGGTPSAVKRARAVAIPPSAAERMAAGKALRKDVAREAHGEWSPAAGRSDPISLLEGQGKDRIQELLPVRYGRMASSAFAFLRGSAIVMAEDLSHTPASGISVQACGDAHLANLGIFATPERNLVFDLNDFDETLPGPWEWDLKRLAASFVVAGRHRGFSDAQNRLAAISMTRTYALRMREFAAMGLLDVWYARIDVDTIVAAMKGELRKRSQKTVEKTWTRDSLQAQAKLTEVVDGARRIKHAPRSSSASATARSQTPSSSERRSRTIAGR